MQFIWAECIEGIDMIFVTVGSQKFQFDRLLREIDRLIEAGVIEDEVYAQTGFSVYLPRHYQYKDFLNRDEFLQHIKRCDVFITHGGTGAIIGAVKMGKKVIAVPRLKEYGEHVDNHQLQLLKEFGNMRIICPCYEIGSLSEAIKEVRETHYNSYLSNTDKIIESIKHYIESVEIK